MLPVSLSSYTKHEQTEYFSKEYDLFCQLQGEPTIINVHRVSFSVVPIPGSTETEDFIRFEPVAGVCIFSKEQAVKTLRKLHFKYDEEQTASTSYDISLSTAYGKPYYCPLLEAQP